jgi:2-oxoglutarate ferredoxin oxidoreductase subunit gamma
VQIVNTSLIAADLVDTEIRTVCIPANDMAHKLGNAKLANMVALGAWLKATEALPLRAVQDALRRVVSANHARLIPVNAGALEEGYNFAGS